MINKPLCIELTRTSNALVLLQSLQKDQQTMEPGQKWSPPEIQKITYRTSKVPDFTKPGTSHFPPLAFKLRNSKKNKGVGTFRPQWLQI